jgi:hypothetical protein
VPAELVADRVAGDRADDGDDDHDPEVQVSVLAVAEHAGYEQRRLTGQHHAKEDRRLGEREPAGDQVEPEADRVTDGAHDVLEHRLMVPRARRAMSGPNRRVGRVVQS